ncbi:hypothetical protein GCM10027060_25050 [Nesterenkonia halophila]
MLVPAMGIGVQGKTSGRMEPPGQHEVPPSSTVSWMRRGQQARRDAERSRRQTGGGQLRIAARPVRGRATAMVWMACWIPMASSLRQSLVGAHGTERGIHYR